MTIAPFDTRLLIASLWYTFSLPFRGLILFTMLMTTSLSYLSYSLYFTRYLVLG